MLILNEAEMLKVLSAEEVMQSVVKAFEIYESKDYFMPDRMHVDLGKKNLLFMPSAANNWLGTKYLTLFPENISRGLPTLYGLMVLNDFDTGRPLCILDGKTLTALRTGAVGGLGTQFTTPEDTSSVGLVGTGVQGYYQLLYASKVRTFKEVYLFDSYKSSAEALKERIAPLFGADTKITICADTTELLERSQLIITTTTSLDPVLPNDASLLKGKHYIGIGSYKPHMREYPDALFSVADSIFVDVELGKEETGDLAYPLEHGLLDESAILSFGDYILRATDTEKVKGGTTFFKSVGMALFDLSLAHALYAKALEKKLGVSVDI